MKEPIFNHITEYYDTLVTKHGHNPKACDCGGATPHELRFKILSEVMPLKNKSVLDVGCGFGDLASYLGNKKQYTGIDISPKMIQEGKRIYPKLDLRLCNILDAKIENYDVIIANGIFYLLGNNAPALMRKIVTRMYELANHAVAFSNLSSWASHKDEGEFYADPCETVKFCRTLTPWVVMRHDYHPGDFIIYMYKDKK